MTNKERTDELDKKFQKDLNAGIATLVLLRILSEATEPMYGYQIAKLVHVEDYSIKQGTLYPVLRALENNGLLESEVEPSVSGPPRRYYRITEDGLAARKRWQQIWNQTKALVDGITAGGNDD